MGVVTSRKPHSFLVKMHELVFTIRHGPQHLLGAGTREAWIRSSRRMRISRSGEDKVLLQCPGKGEMVSLPAAGVCWWWLCWQGAVAGDQQTIRTVSEMRKEKLDTFSLRCCMYKTVNLQPALGEGQARSALTRLENRESCDENRLLSLGSRPLLHL